MAFKIKEETEEKLPLSMAITAIDVGKLPAEVDDFDFGEYEGGGLDRVNIAELAMPFLIVLQANSPQCAPVKAGGVEGAKAGDLYNQATGEIFDGEDGVGFLPCARDHKYIEFFPKEDDGSGGGFVSVRDEDDEQVLKLREEQDRQFGKIWNEEGAERSEGKREPTEFIETYSLIGYTVVDWGDLSTMSRVTVPFASSKIGGYRNFMNVVTGIKYQSQRSGKMTVPPMWSHRYRLRTVYKQRGSQSWYVLNLQLEERPSLKSFNPVSGPLFQIGAAMNKSFESGGAKVSYDRMEAEDRGATSTDTPF